MKKVIMSIVALAAINATAAQYVTVQVCDGGESGTICRNVTYKVRPASAPVLVKETCIIGENSEGPCPKVYGVPNWLQRLNQAFLDAGFTAPTTKDVEAP